MSDTSEATTAVTTPERPPLPSWIKDARDTRGSGHFEVDCDAYYPVLLEQLGIKEADLDQYWMQMLAYFAKHDARIAITRSGANSFIMESIHLKTKANSKFASVPNPHKQGERGRIEYSEVELTPEQPVHKGATIFVDGVAHVCIEEGGCRLMRGGVMESGKFRREAFYPLPVGKGADQALADARELYKTKRGYPPR